MPSLMDSYPAMLKFFAVADPRDDFIWEMQPYCTIVRSVHPLNQQRRKEC